MIDPEHILVILIDLATASFLFWRVSSKKATLWGASKGIYSWVALLSLYHAVIYSYMLFLPYEIHNTIINVYIHPIVLLLMLNPLLVAIIHWRGGHL